MKLRHLPQVLMLALFAADVAFAETSAEPNAAPLAATPDTGVLPPKYTAPRTLSPELEDGPIAQLATRMIERSHFLRREFDGVISERFFERYFESLDPQRMYFLRSDYQEFLPQKGELNAQIARRGDTRLAYDVFNRYLQRIDQQYAVVQEALKGAPFRFDKEERILLNRKDAARPTDLEEAKRLWLDRLRFEYLTEKLGRDFAVTATNVWTRITTASDDDEVKVPAGTTAAADSPAPKSDPKPVITPVIKPIMAGGRKVAEVHVTGLEARLGQVLSTNRAAEVARLAEQGKFTSVADVRAYIEHNLPAERHQDIVKTLTRRYNRVLRNLKQFEPAEVLQWYLDAYAHAYDPHTDYLGRREADAFNMSMTLSFVGIGAVLTSEDGYAVITEIKPGSPAEKSKVMKPGVKIVAVSQDKQPPVDVIDEKLQKVVEQIRGPKGTRVTLTYIPAGADPSVRQRVTIVRDTIPLEDQEAKAKLVLIPDADGRTNRVGVIDLPAFYSGSIGGGDTGKSPTADVAKLLRKLVSEKVDGVVLDLRRNGGGSLEECVRLTGLFIRSGPVVQVVNSFGQKRVLEDDDSDMLYGGPLVVLTGRFSASASEILAGALQDYGRAVVVGDIATHGKGTVQNLQPLKPFYQGPSNPGEVKVTISKFYRPSGSSTQLKGVVPDIVLPSINNYAEVGESSLSNALPWNTIPAVRHEKLNLATPWIPELRRLSSERVLAERDYAYVREDIERFRKQLADRTISLSEKTRATELEDDRLRAALRKAEIRSRREREPVFHEITLKDADKPGLPEPKASRSVIAATRRDQRALQAVGREATAVRRDGQAAADEDGEGEEEGVAADVNLREAERIVIDYAQFATGRRNVASSAPAGKPAAN